MKIFANQCPHCGIGRIYESFLKMNAACPNCGYRYERESGYFTGAMFLESIFLPVSAIPPVVIFALNGKIFAGGMFAVMQMIVLSPLAFRYSRIFWVHLGYALENAEN